MNTIPCAGAPQNEEREPASYGSSYQSETLRREEQRRASPALLRVSAKAGSSISLHRVSTLSFSQETFHTAASQVSNPLAPLEENPQREDNNNNDDEETTPSTSLTDREEDEEEDEEGTLLRAIHSEEDAKQLRQEALKFYNKGEYDDAMKLQYPLVRYAVRHHDGVTDPRNGIYFLDYGLTQLRLLQTTSSMDDVFSEEKRNEAEKDMEACFINLDVARVCFQKQINALEDEEEINEEKRDDKESSMAKEDRVSRRIQMELTLAEVHNALAQLLVEKGDYAAALKEYDTEMFIYNCLEEEYGNGNGKETERIFTAEPTAADTTDITKEEDAKDEAKPKGEQKETQIALSSFVAPPGRIVACLYGAADCYLKEADFEGAEKRLQSALELIRERYPPPIIDQALVEELEDWLAEAREMKGGAYTAMQESIHQQFARDEMSRVLAQTEALSATLEGNHTNGKEKMKDGQAQGVVVNCMNMTGVQLNSFSKEGAGETGEEKVDAAVFHHSAVKKPRKQNKNESKKSGVTHSSSPSSALPSAPSHPFLSMLPLQEENAYSSSFTLPSQDFSNGIPFGSILPSAPRAPRNNSNSTFTLGISERSQSISLFPSQNMSSQHSPFQSSLLGGSLSHTSPYDKATEIDERSSRQHIRCEGQENETIHSATVVKKPKRPLSFPLMPMQSLNEDSSHVDDMDGMLRKKTRTE